MSDRTPPVRISGPEPETLASVLWRAASLAPDRAAIVEHGRETSHARLAGRARRLAAYFAAHGVGKGARVALALRNSSRFIAAHYALQSLGAVVAPLNPGLPADALRRSFERTAARFLVSDAQALETLGGLRSGDGTVPALFAIDSGATKDDGPRIAEARDAALRDGASVDELPDAAEKDRASPGDPAILFLSSGTTGRPKGIPMSHRQALAGIDAWVRRWQFGSATVSLMAAPYFHVVYNPLVIGAHRALGAAAVLEPLQIRAALREVEASRVTALMATPYFFLQLLEDAKSLERDLASLDTLIYGSAPTPVPVIRALAARFPRAGLFNCYGLTETCSALSCLGPEQREGREASVGRAHPGVEISVRDEAWRPLPAGALGEVWCRGPNVVSRYDDAADTARAFREGWLRTGDSGRLDAEGFLYLAGRTDDVINVAGEKVHPASVEEVLHRHEGVLDAAVVGVADAVRGEALKAFVVARSSWNADEQELKRHCLRSLPPAFVPKLVEFVAALPRNAGGKIVRRELQPARTGE